MGVIYSYSSPPHVLQVVFGPIVVLVIASIVTMIVVNSNMVVMIKNQWMDGL